MIEDATQLPIEQLYVADVCIVGAGPAGIAIALDLINSGLSVLLLESGGLGEERDTQELYAGTVVNADLHSPTDRYRQRRFGGSSTIWGGRCVPFDDIDFEARTYVPHSGWPITPNELGRYYPVANRICEAGEFSYRSTEAFAGPLKPMISGFESPNFTTDTLERFSCPTNFAARYGHKLQAAPNVRVLLHANVTSLNLDSLGQRLETVTVQTLAGTKFSVGADRFVLATGGLEAPRLLLASRNVKPNGVGNDHDVVGRYYMCHIAGTVGNISFSQPVTVWHGYDISDEGIYCRRRFALTEETQRRLRLGNFVARLHHPRITDPAHRTGMLSLLYLARGFIPYEYGKRLYGSETVARGTWLRHFRNVAADPFGSFAFMWHMLRDRKLAERKFPSIIIKSRANRYSLDFHCEQEPNPGSRVTLSNECDALGMPRISVDWRYTQGDVDTVQRAIALLAADIEKSGVGHFDCDPATLEFEMTRYGAYGGHHIGTARMGDDPRSSVVDADCKVHGVENLFIASSAVFPTSSQANPTLTVVALALRLAEHLRTNGRHSVATKPSTSPEAIQAYSSTALH